MESDFAVLTDISTDINGELLNFIRERTKNDNRENLCTDIKQIIWKLENDYDNKFVIKKMSEDLDLISDFSIDTYKLSETFSILNETNYSLIRNGFITIGAEASAGKTSLLTALSLDILKNNPDTAFLFYTLDDSKILSYTRIMSQLQKENYFKKPFQKEDQIKSDLKILDRVVIKEYLSIEDIEHEAQEIKTMCGCNKIIIGIDYLQLIQPPAGEDIRGFLNEKVKQLKEIQKRMNCLLFVLSQFNRDTKSITHRYRETSEIENQSDVCFDIYGKYKIIEDPDGKEKNGIVVPDAENQTRRIRVLKNKLGMKGRSFRTKISDDFNFETLEVQQINDYKKGSGKNGQKKNKEGEGNFT